MRGRVLAIRLCLMVSFLVIWAVASGKGGGLSFLPAPVSFAKRVPELFGSYHIWKEASITISYVILSMILTFILGYCFAIFMFYIPLIGKSVEPIVVVFGALPKISLAPIVIILTGFSGWSTLVIAVLFTISTTIISTVTQLRYMPQSYSILMDSLRAKFWSRLYHFYLPYLIPNTIALMKTNIGICFTGVIIGEMQIGKQGLGFLLYYGLQIYRLDLLILIIMILAVLAGGFFILTHSFERKIKFYT